MPWAWAKPHGTRLPTSSNQLVRRSRLIRNGKEREGADRGGSNAPATMGGGGVTARYAARRPGVGAGSAWIPNLTGKVAL
ncbi:hypothetical protein GCM10027048_35990 [Hymenobacter coalescens]